MMNFGYFLVLLYSFPCLFIYLLIDSHSPGPSIVKMFSCFVVFWALWRDEGSWGGAGTGRSKAGAQWSVYHK